MHSLAKGGWVMFTGPSAWTAGSVKPSLSKCCTAAWARRNCCGSRIERQVLARLAHPNVVTILDGGTTPDGRPFLAMQYVEGLPITGYCAAHGLTLEQRLRLFTKVCDGVQFAHSRLVVHRDSKPSNIFVTSDGEVRLLDFGIAKLLRADDDASVVDTRTGMRMLTPEHAAPEQVRGDPVTTDVYALGVLLYQLLSGTRPFQANGRPLVQLERDIEEASATAPSAAGPDRPWASRVRGELDRIVLMALRKEPDPGGLHGRVAAGRLCGHHGHSSESHRA